MIDLKIEIPGRKDFNCQFPENHEEMTRRHLMVLTEFLATAKTDALAYTIMIKNYIGLPRKVVNAIQGEDLFYCEVVDGEVVMMPELTYLQSPYANHHSLLPRWGTWRGPLDRAKNISIERIGYADMFAHDYAEAHTPKMLNLFWAAMYRPALMPWHKSLIDTYAQLARLVPRRVKEAALLNYRGLMTNCQYSYPHVFGSGEKDGSEKYAWEGTIQKLAKTQTFGPYRDARKTPLPNAMIHFEMNGLEVKKMNEKMKQK